MKGKKAELLGGELIIIGVALFLLMGLGGTLKFLFMDKTMLIVVAAIIFLFVFMRGKR